MNTGLAQKIDASNVKQGMKVWVKTRTLGSAYVLILKSPYLAIHKALDDWNDGFTITHIPTGYAVTQQCSTERQAQLICAALAAMPYPWEKCTVKNATELFRALPKCWQDWLQEIRKEA